VGEDGKGFGLSMFFPKLFDEFLGGWVVPQEENGGLGEGPLQMDVSDFGSAGSESFSRRALLAFHESSIGSEVLDAFEALDLVNFVQHGHGEDFPDAGDGAKPEEVLRVMDLRLLGEEELEVLDEQVVVTCELDIGGDALENGRVRELLGDALSIASIVDASLGGRKVVLVVGVLDVGEKLASLAHQGESATEQISSGAHLRRVDVRLRKHSTSKHGRDRERIDAVVLRLATVNRFHVESVTEDEVDAFPCAEVGEPVPGEDALHRDHQVLTKRRDRLQEDVGNRRQVTMKQGFPFLVEDAGVHVPRVKVDAAVVLMGYVVESHQALSFRGLFSTP